MLGQLAIGYENDKLLEDAENLAKQLQLPLDNHAPQQLVLTEQRLILKMPGFSPIYADFSQKTWKKRRQDGKNQGLVRACKPAPGVSIIDATAGWGRDAAVLASFGANVIMLERQAIMAALLADALSRCDTHLDLNLFAADAIDYIQDLTPESYPEIIYIDPMHPVRQKKALVKKTMQVLQQIAGSDEDALTLLTIAREKALKRVVVKWPLHGPPLLAPSACIREKTVRFDIYLK